MAVKVTQLMVLGRIGRLAFRQMFGAEGFKSLHQRPDFKKMLAHLLKYDSTQENMLWLTQ